MTREEAINEIEKVFEPAFANYIITALTEGATSSDEEQQPCEDAISKEAVRRILANQRDELVTMHTVNPKDNPNADAMAYAVNWSLNTLMELPSVTPSRPTGDWIETSLSPISGGDFNRGFKCSCCDYVTVVDDFSYCPNCGAKMEVE